ncbi:armadillo-type protein [Mycena floridula]|nr:armadillo-type protein [Mycena floridula]
MIKLDLPRLLCQKGLRSKSPLLQRYAAWCLGNLIYTDSIADTLELQHKVVVEVSDHLRKVSTSRPESPPEDICAALYPVARISRSIKLAKSLSKAGCIPYLTNHLNSSDPLVLNWTARVVGCLMRPNSSDMAKALLDASIAKGLARLPSVLPHNEDGLVYQGVAPLASFAFAVQRFSCAEWGGGVRKRLVEEGVVDSLLAALRTAADEPCPEVHIELALAVSFLGDVGGKDIRKEITRAGGIDILKKVAKEGSPEVNKACSMAVTSITGNLWTRNAGNLGQNCHVP